MFTVPGVRHGRGQVEVFLEPGGIERHAGGGAGRRLGGWLALGAVLAAGLTAWWAAHPRQAWAIMVDGRPVAAVSSREQAQRILDSITRLQAGSLASLSGFRQQVALEPVQASEQPVLSRWKAQELVARRLAVGVPAYRLYVGGRPVLSVRSLDDVRNALERVVRHQVPAGWQVLGQPRITEKITVEQEWLTPAEARDSLVSRTEAVQRLLAPAVPACEYAVRSGDVAARIARRHDITLDELQRANPGTDLNRLQVGDRLVIAGSRPLVSVRIQAQKADTAPVGFWTENVPSARLALGQRRVVQRGRPGEQRVTIIATFVNGMEVARRTMWGEVVRGALPERVLVGSTAAPARREPEDRRAAPSVARGWPVLQRAQAQRLLTCHS